jgi:DNA-binding response OmpR family regulator
MTVDPGSTHVSMTSMPSVLVVEDEPGIRSSLRRALEAEGFLVQEAADGAEGLARALAPEVDLVILDLGLPRLSGDDVLALIREQRPALPVLVLTARDDVDDRVRALDQGAADYVLKPFALAELMARVRLRLRAVSPATTGSAQLRAGRVGLDVARRVADVAGTAVVLTPQETALLAQFLQHPEEVLTRSDLLRAVWGLEQAPRRSNLVDVGVAALRRRLDIPCIETVRGEGYRYLG